ncbi:MAG TPA: polysaccharide biosynthesis protein [Candidatus Ruminococcus gallistercoris]|nr:polysaccharide biosynthesis protein [Candidatus Ruminococcus gallistercoris]
MRQSFLHGALLLTAGVLLVKVVGALFKIPLSAVITEDGMGYFSTAYSFYNVIFSIATAGFPVAVSRMVSENDSLGRWRDVRRIKQAASPVFLLTGAVGTGLMILGAPLYTRAVGNAGALPAMLALAPSVLLCSLAAVYRGYYEGLRNMTPTTVSQVIEALAKLLFGLSGAYFVMARTSREFAASGTVLGRAVADGAEAQRAICAFGAAAAILGVTLGSALSLLYLYLRDRRGDGIPAAQLARAPQPQPRRTLARQLVRSSIPIAVGAVAMSISGLIDASFLQTRIAHILRTDPAPLLAMYAGSIPQANLDAPESIPNYLFGCYNMALTLFMIVPSVTQAFGVSALPSVTHAFARGVKAELRAAMETVLRATSIFALPAGIGLSVLAGPIARLVYGDRPSTPIIAAALAAMGAASIFAAVTTPLGSMLQAVGHMELPVILVLSGLVVKVVLNYILAGVPQINILGGGISTLVCYVLVTVAELFALVRITGIRFDFVSTVFKPLLAAGCCGAAAYGVWRCLARATGGARLDALFAVAAGAAVYAAALVLLRAVRPQELKRLLRRAR